MCDHVDLRDHLDLSLYRSCVLTSQQGSWNVKFLISFLPSLFVKLISSLVQQACISQGKKKKNRLQTDDHYQKKKKKKHPSKSNPFRPDQTDFHQHTRA